tara:strand:+ start:378 stop:1079 length:702 start_codon:yes stop_codon:yes gene_type:complete
MGIRRGPNIVTSGLVFAIDAANPTSYPGSGTIWKDQTVNQNNGTLTNGPTFDSGNGGSIVFDGSNDYVDCGNIDDIKNASQVSISIWTYIDDISFRILLGQNLISGTDQFQLYYWNANTLYIWIKSGNVGTVSYVNTSSIVNINQWYNFTLVFDGTLTNNDRAKLYLNGGNDIITNRGTMPTTFTNSSESFLIGRGLNGYFDGRMSNTQIYNRALSDSEVTQNYNALKGRFGL